MNKGIIIKAISGFYYVKTDNNIFECHARGKFRNEDISPLVGDIAEISDISEDKHTATINKILPRKNSLYRPPIANIDKVIVVLTPKKPAPNLLFTDKILAIAENRKIEPVILINKTDLFDGSELVKAYRAVGYKVIETSAEAGEGIDALIDFIKGSVSVFAGSSGVGKSSLINLVCRDKVMETGEISKISRGKHTTRHTELFPLPCGGFVADSPGFSQLELIDISAKELACCFREFKEHLGSCRFPDCSHTKENDCMIVQDAINGKINKFRHDNYITLYNKLKSINEWEK